MKKLILVLQVALLPLGWLRAQRVDMLFGIKTASTQVFASLNVPGSNYTNLSSFVANEGIYSMHTFDDLNDRYFVHTTTHILVFNALSGRIVDTIPVPSTVIGMEYDPGNNSIIGLSSMPPGVAFVSIDVATKAFYNWGRLPGITGSSGESTFDPVKRRYFVICQNGGTPGVVVVDSNYTLADFIPTSPYFGGMEYDPGSDMLFGVYWSGRSEIFAALNFTTRTVGDAGVLDGAVDVVQGGTTFDKATGHYYIETDSGIYEIDCAAASTIRVLPDVGNYSNIEFRSVPDTNPVGLKRNDCDRGLAVGPNPSAGMVTFSSLNKGDKIEIFNQIGILIQQAIASNNSITIDLNSKGNDLYFYRLSADGKVTASGKLLVQE